MQEYEIREVADTDKWCKRRIPREGVPEIDAPFGYVITLPSCPSENTILDNIKGYVIVRKKKRFGKVMLQVIKKEQAPQYGIKSGARQEPKKGKKKRRNKKKLNRIINVKNLSKSGGDWGKKIN
jgi:hypothetical protein